MKMVFSHLGHAPARHLISNIKRTKSLFPNYDIELILSSANTIRDVPKYVGLHVYETKPDIQVVLEKLEHDERFRGGFWRFSLERLFALELVHEKFPNTPILHIESDVIIFPNTPLDEIARNTLNALAVCT